MEISLSSSALDDLESVINHYTKEGVAHIGVRYAEDIIGHVQVLAAHPDLGRIVPEFGQATIRELIHGPFRVVYLRETDAIKVIRVWRSERLLVLPDDQ